MVEVGGVGETDIHDDDTVPQNVHGHRTKYSNEQMNKVNEIS